MSNLPNLFSQLSRYTPREDRTPLEDFTTEAFAAVLQQSKALTAAFIMRVLQKHDLEKKQAVISESVEPIIETQARIEVKQDCFRRPDMMVWGGNNMLLVGEHKAWSSPDLHESKEGTIEGKMGEYGEWLKKKKLPGHPNEVKQLYFLAPYSESSYTDADQLPGHPECLTWSDITALISQVIDGINDVWERKLLEQFSSYLDDEGLAVSKVEEVNDEAWVQLGSLLYQIETALNDAGFNPKYFNDSETGRSYSGFTCSLKSREIGERIIWVGMYYHRPRNVVCAIGKKDAEEYGIQPSGDLWRDAGKELEYVIKLDEDYFGKERVDQVEHLKDYLVTAFNTLSG